MDLGFGGSNQVVGDKTARALLQSTQIQESVIDNEISKYDSLLENNDAELEAIRQRRLTQMKQQQKQKLKFLNELGHGTYTEIHPGQGADVAKEFFSISKKSERLVVHFYRTSTKSCDIFHSHLTKLAQEHIETKFVKINVEKCDTDGGGATYLVEKLGIVVMPTIVIIKDRKAIHHIRGFDELKCGSNPENFTTKELAYLIGLHGGLIRKDDEMEPPSEEKDDQLSSLGSGLSKSLRLSSSKSINKSKKGIFNNSTNSSSSSIRNGLYQEEYDDEED